MGILEWMVTYHSYSHGISNLRPAKNSDAIRIGILGAADFTPIGLFNPAQTHPDVTITAIGARSLERAQQQARQYGVPRAFGSYQEVIDLDDVDAIYIVLPIAKHAQWAIKAARAGKHVLCEKLLCCNEAEAREIEECSKETGKVILEAFHWQHFPVNHVLKSIVDSGRYGQLLSIQTSLYVLNHYGPDDIRANYNLGGGAAMDLAYVFSAIQYFVGRDGEYEVTKADPVLYAHDRLVDHAMEVEMTFTPRNGARPVLCRALADLRPPRTFGIIPQLKYPEVKLRFDNADITLTNYVAPHHGHDLIIEDKTTGIKTKQSHYSFGPKWGPRSEVYWTTYRYQLEAFVMKVRGEEPPHWIGLDESAELMAMIDQIYDKAGLPRRGLDLK